jgi:hypothetical protein
MLEVLQRYLVHSILEIATHRIPVTAHCRYIYLKAIVTPNITVSSVGALVEMARVERPKHTKKPVQEGFALCFVYAVPNHSFSIVYKICEQTV